MLSAVCVGTNDLTKASAFYEELLAILGMVPLVKVHNETGFGYKGGKVSFWVLIPFNGEPASFGNGTQVMFQAETKEMIILFHETALRLGGSDEGAPGPRDYSENYYGAYCRDPDGNKLHVFL